LKDVVRLIKELEQEAQTKKLEVQGIGVGVCELVDLKGQVISANSIAWKGLPVQKRLAKLRPAVVEADVRAAALAEAIFGAGRRLKIFLYITVGTGISSCLVLEGKPFTGARGATGTMASAPLPIACQGSPEAAMPEQTLEEIASGPALVRRYNRCGKGRVHSAEEVCARVQAGEREAMLIVESAGATLGATVGLLVNVLDPEAVIVGGGLGLSGGLYWDSFITSARRHLWADAHQGLPILRAAQGADSAMLGAACAAWKKLCPNL